MEYMKVIRTHREQCNTCDFDRLYQIHLAKSEWNEKKILGLSERKTNIENKTLIRINSISILCSLLE